MQTYQPLFEWLVYWQKYVQLIAVLVAKIPVGAFTKNI